MKGQFTGMGTRKAEMKEVSAKYQVQEAPNTPFLMKTNLLEVKLEWHSRKEGLEGLEMLLPTVSP